MLIRQASDDDGHVCGCGRRVVVVGCHHHVLADSQVWQRLEAYDVAKMVRVSLEGRADTERLRVKIDEDVV